MNCHLMAVSISGLWVCGLLEPSTTLAGCIAPVSDAAAFDASGAVAELEVLSSESSLGADQTIQTRIILQLVESFKGEVPTQIEMTVAGGNYGGRCDFRSDSLALEVGKSYVLLLNRDSVGNWSAHPQHAYRMPAKQRAAEDFFRKKARGPRPQLLALTAAEVVVGQANSGVPSSVVTPTGYVETGGQPTRFSTCDGDDPIPYLIDVDPTKLPTGMSQAAAIAAVEEVMNAWASASSLKLYNEGTQAFGAAASSITIQDRRLRIQLHDNYNAITTAGVLGVGGGSFQSSSTTFSGGKVGTQGFQERLYGYVVLKSTDPFMLNVANFKRVLTHEIGHALGLAHSSENAAEPDAILKAATMYYSTAAGSTGATIQVYDVDRIQFGYPVSNTPPYTMDRIIPAITTDISYGALPSGVLGVNLIQLYAMDRQGSAVTAVLTSSTALSGTFSLTGNLLSYTPIGFFGDSRLTDAQITAGTYYDKASIQFSDGVNLSRVANCTVIGFASDTTPSDGLPDSWMLANFSTITPGAVGSGRNPADDPDKDGLSNRVEFYLNTHPNQANSGPVKPSYQHSTRQLGFTPIRFAPYRIESSSTLASGSWSLRRLGTLYQPSGMLNSNFTGNPAPAKEFYRVVTGP